MSTGLVKHFEKVTDKQMTKMEIAAFLDNNAPYDFQSVEQKFTENQTLYYPYFIRLSNGKTGWLNTTIVGMENHDNELMWIVGIIEDQRLSDQQNINNTHFYRDQDYSLPNFGYGFNYIENLIKNESTEEPSFVLYKVVISNFDKVATTYGLEVADYVLFHTSKRLTKFMHNRGFLFHSYTVGWYAVIESTRDVEQIIDEMIEILSEPLRVNQEKVTIHTTIGSTLYPNNGDNAIDLMKRLAIIIPTPPELNMKEHQFLVKGENTKLLKRSQLAMDLYHCIERNELFLEYQPKIDAKTLEVTGAEALIRWQHPVWGRISPAEFLPLTVNMGLEGQVTRFVIEETIGQISKWEKDGIYKPSASLNVSPDMLRQPVIYDFIKSIFEKYNISPSQLEIEVTEEAMLTYDDVVKRTISSIQSLGVRFALDDMGQGFTSLYDLTHFNFSTLKIDRRAIDNIDTSQEQQIILTALLDICNNLNIKSVIEGVETREQFDVLRGMRCDEIQGFYFSPSISSEEMSEWFKIKYARPQL